MRKKFPKKEKVSFYLWVFKQRTESLRYYDLFQLIPEEYQAAKQTYYNKLKVLVPILDSWEAVHDTGRESGDACHLDYVLLLFWWEGSVCEFIELIKWIKCLLNFVYLFICLFCLFISSTLSVYLHLFVSLYVCLSFCLFLPISFSHT